MTDEYFMGEALKEAEKAHKKCMEIFLKGKPTKKLMRDGIIRKDNGFSF